MKRISLFCCAIALVPVFATTTFGAKAPASVELKGGETPAQVRAVYAKAISELAPNLAKSDSDPLQTFESIVHHAARPGAEAERAACCQVIAAALQTELPAEAKAWMLKLAAFAGGPEMVTAAAKLLDDSDALVRESARAALQQIPLAGAAVPLRTALGRATDPKWQGALILALGTRKDAASVMPIGRFLEQGNEATLEAALFALGQIANETAARALAAGLQTVPEKFRSAAAESYAKCAEQMLRAGQTSRAATIYRDLYQSTLPRPVRLAALVGVLKSSGNAAAGKVLELLSGDDADGRAIAAGFINELDGAGLKSLAAGMGKLPPPTQAMVLGVLSDRGEKSALPEALEAAKNADETIRVAGLSALGRLGNAACVPMLTETMAAGGPAAAAARASLLRLEGAGVPDAILAAMQKQTDPARCGDLIAVLESRGGSMAVPALAAELDNNNPSVRRAALRALGRLAGPTEVPVMLKALLRCPPGGDRDEGERAIASACGRISDPARQAGPVLAAYQEAGPAERAVLLPLLGRFGGARSLEAVKVALAGNDPALQKAAETALANWPDADDAVEGELVTLVQRSQNAGERAAALRAYVRAVSLPSGLPEKTRLAKFQKAMELASRDEERIFVLERVGEIKHIETLRFLVPSLDNPALANRAGGTICDLARERGLRDRNKAEFEQALNKVVAVCKEQAVIDRAKRRLQEK